MIPTRNSGMLLCQPSLPWGIWYRLLRSKWCIMILNSVFSPSRFIIPISLSISVFIYKNHWMLNLFNGHWFGGLLLMFMLLVLSLAICFPLFQMCPRIMQSLMPLIISHFLGCEVMWNCGALLGALSRWNISSVGENLHLSLAVFIMEYTFCFRDPRFTSVYRTQCLSSILLKAKVCID